MAELVDASDSKSDGPCVLVGSSPTLGTIYMKTQRFQAVDDCLDLFLFFGLGNLIHLRYDYFKE